MPISGAYSFTVEINPWDLSTAVAIPTPLDNASAALPAFDSVLTIFPP